MVRSVPCSFKKSVLPKDSTDFFFWELSEQTICSMQRADRLTAYGVSVNKGIS